MTTPTPTPHGAMPELLPCPFCGRKVDDDLSDTLYPSGTYWREEDGLRHYIGHRDRNVVRRRVSVEVAAEIGKAMAPSTDGGEL